MKRPQKVIYEMGTGKHRAPTSIENMARTIADEAWYELNGSIPNGTGRHRGIDPGPILGHLHDAFMARLRKHRAG